MWPGQRMKQGTRNAPSQFYVTKFIETFKEFPPRQKPASFGIDQALEALQNSAAGR